jgi:cytochrome c553
VLPHLSELHGASTHLAVVAIPVYLLITVLRRLGRGGDAVAVLEPWVLAAMVLGVAAAGLTGLLVWGQAQQGLPVHFWLGIALALVVVFTAGLRYRPIAARRPAVGLAVIMAAALAFAMDGVQGYVGGRMTYEHGIGVEAGGQFAQTARGADALHLALAGATSPAAAGAAAFATTGLGCAACHGDHAQGARGPALAGGRGLDAFRRVHAHGLFPPSVVNNRDYAAILAFLKTQPGQGRG